MGLDVPFSKMNGAGNKIIVADMRGRVEKISAAAAVNLNAHKDTAFDQIMEIRDTNTDHVDQDIRILNSDGSTARACGNGTRCVVQWLNGENAGTNFTFKTVAGILNTNLVDDGLVSVDMGVPLFDWQDIPLKEEFFDTTKIELQIGPIDAPVLHSPSVANIGNPQCVFWVDEDVYSHDLERLGPMLENHPIFPDRANITLAQVLAPDHIKIRTWERGAGITLACGSAACATLVCAVRKEFSNRKATISVPGGELIVEWREDSHVILTGPAQHEFDGMMDPETGEIQLGNKPDIKGVIA